LRGAQYSTISRWRLFSTKDQTISGFDHLFPVRKDQVRGHAAFLSFGHQLRLGLGHADQPGRLAGKHFLEMAPDVGMNQAHDGDGMLRRECRQQQKEKQAGDCAHCATQRTSPYSI
jgi:hypothetical protein